MSHSDLFPPLSSPFPRTRRPSRGSTSVLPVVLGLSSVLTTAGGLVIGRFAVSFQLFGDAPDAKDYQVAAGAYAASAVVLMLGALAARSFRAPRWEALWMSGWATVMVVLALTSASKAATAADPGPGFNGWLDGVGGVLACPWTWPLLVLGLLAAARGSRVSG